MVMMTLLIFKSAQLYTVPVFLALSEGSCGRQCIHQMRMNASTGSFASLRHQRCLPLKRKDGDV